MKLKKVISLAVAVVMALAVPFTAMAANNEFVIDAETANWAREDVWAIAERTDPPHSRIYADLYLTSDDMRITELTLNLRDVLIAIPEGEAAQWSNITIEFSTGQRASLAFSVLANNTIDEFGFGIFDAMQGGAGNFAGLSQLGGDRLFGATAIQGLRQALVAPANGTNDFDFTVSIDGGTATATLVVNDTITYTVEQAVAGFTPETPAFITSVTAMRTGETAIVEFNWGLTATTLAGTTISTGMEAAAPEVVATPAPTAPPAVTGPTPPDGEVDKVQTPDVVVPISGDNVTIITAVGLVGAIAVAGLFVFKKVRTN